MVSEVKHMLTKKVDFPNVESSPATSLAEDEASELVVDEDAAEVESEDAADADDVQPLNLTTRKSDLLCGTGKRENHVNTLLTQFEEIRVQTLIF